MHFFRLFPEPAYQIVNPELRLPDQIGAGAPHWLDSFCVELTRLGGLR